MGFHWILTMKTKRSLWRQQLRSFVSEGVGKQGIKESIGTPWFAESFYFSLDIFSFCFVFIFFSVNSWFNAPIPFVFLFHSPHPYIFFNHDRVSMTFVGFRIDQNGNLIHPDSLEIIQPNLMSRQLRTGLTLQRIDFETNCGTWSK